MHPLLDLTARPVIGHRGNRAHAPENTIESFRQAVALGADALEFDLRLTRDGEVVVIHDPTVDRTTDGVGRVAELTLAELRGLDAGATFSTDGGKTHPYRGRGIGIATLAEVLESLDATPMLLEIKVAEAAAATRAVIERMGQESRCIVSSFQAGALVPFAGTRIPIGASPQAVAPLLLPALLGRRFTALPFQVMSLPRFHRGLPIPLGALARAAEPAGVPLHVWTVNAPSVARRLWRRGVRGIISDDPATILRERERFTGRSRR
ncbi:MAG: glycerophosphoryl diester phosphodiesterase [Gemmatimonadota bacterium]